MMIRSNFSGNYRFEPQRYLDFTPYGADLSGISLYLGVYPPSTEGDTNFKVRLNVETPNFLYNYNINEENERYDLVLHICPFTCAFLNDVYKTTKYRTTFFPITFKDYVEQPRAIDVFYTGHKILSCKPVAIIVEEVSKRIGESTYSKLMESMSGDDGYFKKLELLNNTKICIVHNSLSPPGFFPNFSGHIADPLCVKHLPWHSAPTEIVPQLKTRIFEGAMMRCVLLVYKDKYRHHEAYFKENEDFLYWETPEELSAQVDAILSNYEAYVPMAISAHTRMKTCYQVKNFVDHVVQLKRELQA
jgi:hypothetical protein